MTSAHLALLVEIQRTGSLARAALNLEVTPPAISQQLARIEREMGVALVERGARGAKLTPLGERLAAHGVRVTEELRQADETAADFIGTHRNRLRVGAPLSMSVALLPEVLAALRYQHPDAQLSVVDVMSDAGGDLVADGELDVALTASYGATPKSDRYAVQHLLSDPLLVVAPDDHMIAKKAHTEPLDLATLSGEHWVSGPPGRPSRTQLDDAAAEAGFVPIVPFQTESYDVAQALSDAGVAITLIPQMAWSKLPTTVTRSLTAGLTREIYAVLPTSVDHVPLAPEFLRVLRQVAAGFGSAK